MDTLDPGWEKKRDEEVRADLESLCVLVEV